MPGLDQPESNPMGAEQIIIVAAILIAFILLATVFGIFLTLFRPWLRAFLSGVPITLFQLVGMKLRRLNTRLILEQGIAASQAGHPVSWADLERACLQKVDLEKVTQAYITSRKRDENFTFDELVSAEQATRTRV